MVSKLYRDWKVHTYSFPLTLFVERNIDSILGKRDSVFTTLCSKQDIWKEIIKSVITLFTFSIDLGIYVIDDFYYIFTSLSGFS